MFALCQAPVAHHGWIPRGRLEEDGAPWGTEVALSGEWQEVRLTPAQLRYFKHWNGPAARGGTGDHWRPDKTQMVNVCFGAWLFPDKAAENHAVELEGIWLECESATLPR